MNKDEDTYRPISCSLYSEYELAIMYQQQVRLVWHESGQTHIARLRPLDLVTLDHQEFLIATNQRGDKFSIRLDHIRSQVFMD